MTPDAPASSGKMVVVIDDDVPGRRLMRRILERRGYVVDDAGDGANGLALVRTTMPRAVLLDLRMPGTMSGLDVLKELQNNEPTTTIPVVIVSASVDSNARALALNMGAAAFLEKPVDFHQLYATLDGLLE